MKFLAAILFCCILCASTPAFPRHVLSHAAVKAAKSAPHAAKSVVKAAYKVAVVVL